MRSNTALCHCEASVFSNYQRTIKLIVQSSCVVDGDKSLGSRVAESKVGRVGEASHQMTYYVICKLHESGVQLRTKRRLSVAQILLHFSNCICINHVAACFLCSCRNVNNKQKIKHEQLCAFILKSWGLTAAYEPIFLLIFVLFHPGHQWGG